MKVQVAYAIVVLLGHPLGMLAGFIGALLLFWVPDRVGVPLRTFFGKCAASIATVGFGFLVFRWLVGAGSFAVLPYLATILPVSIFLLRDFGKYQRMQQIDVSDDCCFEAVLATERLGAGTYILGGILGILIGGYLFIYLLR